jgi:maltose O-acetyltransferase
MPGVTIGDNVIIGAMSLVTKDIPSNSVAYGQPAKVVKKIEEVIPNVNEYKK